MIAVCTCLFLFRVVMALYGNRPAGEQQQQQQQEQPPMASPAASSNSDSGIFKEQQQQRLAGEPGLSVRAMPAPAAAAANDGSFNSERLEDQNSAENLRVSMQKYLKSKDAVVKDFDEADRTHFESAAHDMSFL